MERWFAHQRARFLYTLVIFLLIDRDLLFGSQRKEPTYGSNSFSSCFQPLIEFISFTKACWVWRGEATIWYRSPCSSMGGLWRFWSFAIACWSSPDKVTTGISHWILIADTRLYNITSIRLKRKEFTTFLILWSLCMQGWWILKRTLEQRTVTLNCLKKLALLKARSSK